MTHPILEFIAHTVRCSDALETLMLSDFKGSDVEHYAGVRLELLKSAEAAAESWMKGDFSSPPEKLLLEKGSVRILIGPLQQESVFIRKEHERLKNLVPDIKETEVVTLLIKHKGGADLVQKHEVFKQRLAVLAASETAKSLLEKDYPETWALLTKRYAAQETKPDVSPGGMG